MCLFVMQHGTTTLRHRVSSTTTSHENLNSVHGVVENVVRQNGKTSIIPLVGTTSSRRTEPPRPSCVWSMWETKK